MLFNIMPKITNPKGIATNIRGCINSLLLRLLIAFGYWKREGIRTRDTFAVEPEPKPMPPLSVWPGLLPLARHYSSRKWIT
jgi:hypothetical protein